MNRMVEKKCIICKDVFNAEGRELGCSPKCIDVNNKNKTSTRNKKHKEKCVKWIKDNPHRFIFIVNGLMPSF